MRIRTIVVGLAVAASALTGATPAFAHGSCTTTAYPPTAGSGNVRGKGQIQCTEFHSGSDIVIIACLQTADLVGNAWSEDMDCAVSSTGAGANLSRTTYAEHSICPLTPIHFRTHARGYIVNRTTWAVTHLNDDYSQGVLVERGTCTVMPQVTT